MCKVENIMINLFGKIEATTAGIYYKPLKQIIEYIDKINPQHYKIYCQYKIVNEIKKIAEYYKMEYKCSDYLPKNVVACVVDKNWHE